METKIIFLGSFESTMRFINAIDHVDARFYLTDEGFRVNAKSVLGVLSMNLAEPMSLEIIGTPTDLAEANSAIRDYLVC